MIVKKLDLITVNLFILDEADEILSSGFKDQIKTIFGFALSPLSIIVPPALIISQGMGTVTALTWVSIASFSWPDSIIDINSNLLLITLICSCIVSVLGGKIRSRAQLLQLSIFIPIGALFSQWLLIGNDQTSLVDNQKFFISNRKMFM